MKIKDFIKFLKENIREDDLSHLNDGLPANKRNEARWPEDDYDYDDDSTKDYEDDYDDDDDYYYGKMTSSNPKFSKGSTYDDYDDDDYDDEKSQDMEHLNHLLRQMFKNAGIPEVSVTARTNKEILIECYLKNKTNLRDVIKVFEVANKLKRDILAQYNSEFDIWQHKDRSTFAFGFELGDGLEDDTMPF